MDALLESEPPESNFYDETANAFRDALDALNRQKARINALEAKIARLEAAIEVLERRKYMGVYKPNGIYSEGSSCTRDGSVFYALKTTREAPGDGCTDWVLGCKRGRDGRDGKDATAAR
jgi:ABC-type Zn uptake system ZnuABC Zn-binding protein ZnuA